MKLSIVRKLFFAILFAASTIAAQAHRAEDANIAGHVLDRNTGRHIPFVSISVKGTNIGVISDATGHFRINDLPVGRLTIVASSVGYTSKELEVTTESGRTIEVNFEIEEQFVLLDQVVVSANRNEVRRQEAVGIVSVVTPIIFEQTASACLADGLNFLPGLRVENTCGNCGFPQLRINGLQGPYTQILINSRPINSALAGVYGLEHIPVNMIERVEVIRGGGSALFGSSAIGGTVNIITRQPSRNTFSIGNTTSFIYGRTPDIISNLNASVVSDNNRVGVNFFASARQRSHFDANNDGFSELGEINLNSFGFRGFYRTTHNSTLNFEYHTTNEFRRGGNMFDRLPHEADVAEQTEHRIHSGALRYDIFFNGGRHALQFYSSMQHIERDSYYGAGQDLYAYGNTNDLSLVSGVQYSLNMDRFLFMPSTFTGGFEHSHNALRDEMPGRSRTIEQDINIYSIFIQNEWSNRRASILLGGRMDKHSMIDNPVFSPRISARFAPIPWLTLRGSFATGFRGPQAFDEDLHVATVGGGVALISLAEDLEPERSHSFTFSAEFNRVFNQRSAFSFLAEGFFTRLDNVFVIDEVELACPHGLIQSLCAACAPNGTNLHLERRNGAGAIVAGVNLEANFIASRDFRINSGFTIQTAKYTEPETWSSSVAPQRRMFRSPNTYGYITAVYSPIRQLDLSLSGVYTGSMLVQHFAGYIDEDREVETPSFFNLTGRVAYTFDLVDNVQLQLSAGVRNIFNSYQRSFDIGKNRDSGFIYGPTTPRTIFFGARLSL